MADDKISTIEPHLLDLLEPEERAALMESEDFDLAALKAVAGDADEDDEDDEGEDEAQASAPVEGEAAGEAKEPAAEAASEASESAAESGEPAAAEGEAPAKEVEPQRAAYRYALPDDYEARAEANRAAQLALYEKYKEGDMPIEELQAEQARLTGERDELLSHKMRADIAADMQRQSQEAARDAAVNALFDRTKAAIDYRKDEGAMRQLDRAVKLLAGDEANSDKPLDWFLDEAHRMVQAMRGVVAAPAPKQDAVKAAAAARKPDLSAAPKTLAQAPAAGGAGDVGSEFDDIMNLDGEAFEDALANMARTNPQRFARFQAGGQ